MTRSWTGTGLVVLTLFALTATAACAGESAAKSAVDVCDLTGTEFVEQTFETTVQEPKRTELSLAGGFGDYHHSGAGCHYREVSGERPLALNTVLNHCKKTDPQACLDASFIDWNRADRPVLDYKKLNGLGDGAGYLEDAGLVVVVAKPKSTWTIGVRSGFTMTEDQYRTVAERMVKKFDG